MRTAGFWRRAAAWSLDAALVALPVLVLCASRMPASAKTLADAWDTLADTVARRMAAAIMATDAAAAPAALPGLVGDSMRDPALLAAATDLQAALLALAGPPLVAFMAMFSAWCVAFERSALQATPGKRALGLRVVDAADGGRIGLARAVARFLAGTFSWLALNLGHALAAIPPERAALHDRLSRTRVVLDADAPEQLPGWAAAWLLLQAAVLVPATAWIALATAAAMQAAVDRALWG